MRLWRTALRSGSGGMRSLTSESAEEISLGLSGDSSSALYRQGSGRGAEVLLMDEPTSALDPISTLKIEDLMDDLKSKYTVAIVTHNMQQATRIATTLHFSWWRGGGVCDYGRTFSPCRRIRDRRLYNSRFG